MGLSVLLIFKTASCDIVIWIEMLNARKLISLLEDMFLPVLYDER